MSTSIGLIRGERRDIAFIEDISQGGMKLRGVIDPKRGEVLRLHAKGCVFSVQVVWTRGVYCGVRFVLDKDASELRRFMTISLDPKRARSETGRLRIRLPVIPNTPPGAG
jgi:hypothetical protein